MTFSPQQNHLTECHKYKTGGLLYIMPEQKKRHFSPHILLLALIIIVQCVFYIFIFTTKKDAYHADEYYSYGLSNSFYRPYLHGSAIRVMDNYDVWMTGDEFKYFLRTNENTKFRYDSVWHNQKEDTNPPLHYAILHTICSVFCDQFSWWYAFSINLVCFIVTQIFLYLLVIQLCRSKNAALLVVAGWAFSLSAIGNFLFLRFYAMLTMLAVMYTYYSIKAIRKERFCAKDWIAIGLTAFCGAMTAHLFLIFAFLVTALICLYLICKRNWKRMFCFGFAAAIGILLSFAAFPATFSHLFATDDYLFGSAEQRIIWMDVILYINILLKSTFGFGVVEVSDFWLYTKAVSMLVIPTLLLLAFVFRKEIKAHFPAFKERCKIIFRASKKYIAALLLLFISSTIYVIFTGCTSDYNVMENDSVRYIYMIPPLLYAAIVALLYLFGKVFSRKWFRNTLYIVLTACFGLVLFTQNQKYEPQFVKHADMDHGRLSEFIKDQSCILLVSHQLYMTQYGLMFEDAKEVYETTIYDQGFLKDYQKAEYQKLFDKNEPFLLVFDKMMLLDDEFYERLENNELSEDEMDEYNFYGDYFSESRIVRYFEEMAGWKATYLGRETTHISPMVAYRFDPPAA